MAEHPAVNRRVVGSSPTRGADAKAILKALKSWVILNLNFKVGYGNQLWN